MMGVYPGAPPRCVNTQTGEILPPPPPAPPESVTDAIKDSFTLEDLNMELINEG